MDKQVIKTGVMLKMSQQKKRTSPKNIKERLFVLTSNELSYYEHDKGKMGPRKGGVLVDRILCVQKVQLEEPTAVQRQHPFQVVHDDGPLYVFAKDEEGRRDWLEALTQVVRQPKLTTMYHRGFWMDGKFLCCKQTSKTALGCSSVRTNWSSGLKSPELMTLFTDKHKQIHPCLKAGERTTAPLPVPVQKTSSSKELADRVLDPGNQSPSRGPKQLALGEDTVQFREGPNRKSSQSDPVPADGVEDYPWYVGRMSQAKTEELLKQLGKAGTFVVRDSSLKGAYTVSLFSPTDEKPNGVVVHYRISESPDRCFYLARSHTFHSVPQLIEYHQKNGAGLVTRLRHPAFSQKPLVLLSEHGSWELQREDVTLLRELGRGQFGVVHLALWKGKFNVAVKMVREGFTSSDDFMEEAKTMILPEGQGGRPTAAPPAGHVPGRV